MNRAARGAFVLLVLGASSSLAQGTATLRRAEAAIREIAIGQTIADARRALDDRLTRAEQARAYELLGFAYAALDSARASTEAFKQLLFLYPDRELDPARISPKITSLFALALGQVLVVRHLTVDSSSFIAGSGSMTLRFAVTRTARVRTRIVGAAGDAVVDSSLGNGTLRLVWNGLMRDGRPAATGDYRIVVEASSGRDSYAASAPVRVTAGAADTTRHLVTLPGYTFLPETEVPARSWRPLGVAFLATAAASGAAVAFESSSLGSPQRTTLVTIGIGTSIVGLLATLKQPAPVPSTANIRYNALLREQLARRNAEIASDNARRQTQVKLTVIPLATPAAKESAP